MKVGLCAAPPVGQPHALLGLSNSCCFATTLETLTARFDKLYRRRAHLHHFTQYMEADGLASARDELLAVRDEYERLGGAAPPPEACALLERLKGAPT